MRLSYTTRALAEIEELQDYVASRNPAAAVRTAGVIRAQLATLASHPGKGRIGRVPGTRELVVSGTRYVVPYRIDDATVVVLAVIHSSQDWPDSF